MANVYLIGNRVRLSAAFTDINGTASDPTVASLTVKAPDGTTTTPSPTKDSVGNYHADIDVGMAGPWAYRWAGSGALVAAAEGLLLATDSTVT